jgi:hypothetical protein
VRFSFSAYMQNLKPQFCKFPSFGGVPKGRGGLKNENEIEHEYADGIRYY